MSSEIICLFVLSQWLLNTHHLASRKIDFILAKEKSLYISDLNKCSNICFLCALFPRDDTV